jgi:hypothetical protein
MVETAVVVSSGGTPGTAQTGGYLFNAAPSE